MKRRHSSLASFKLLLSLILFVHGWELCSQLNRSCSSHSGLFKAINEGNGYPRQVKIILFHILMFKHGMFGLSCHLL